MTMQNHIAEVRALYRAVKAREPSAIRRMRHYLPLNQSFIMSHVKFVVAREAGYNNWPALKNATGNTMSKSSDLNR